MKKKLLALMIVSAFMAPAYANEAVARKVAPGGANGCKMQENVTLSINFTIRAKSFAESRTKYEEKMQQVTNFATQQGIKKFQLQSMNYNINSQNVNYDGMPEPGYQLSGNASYLLDSADSAFKLGEFLGEQKMQVSVNVNKYQNGSCNNAAVAE